MKRITMGMLKKIAEPAAGKINKIYLHWTAGHYDQYFDDYHINIDSDGSIVVTTYDFTEMLAHTWRRNTGAIGIALCCAYNASANNGYDADFGYEPPTEKQIESMAEVIAALSQVLNISINDNNVMTHQEAATIDGYGPESQDPETRWDLWYLPDYDGAFKPGGDVLRGKALWYLQN